ncbi:hypothetical protein GGF43_000456 [Coemansia sp. RSA 2618]|nr:hypothetical protein GGF43_000456 [Coemansia sp. RSA 2618]
MEAVEPEPSYVPEIPMPKPEPTTNPPLIKIKNTLQLPDIELSDEKDEKPVPKVLSFQEIMERKRRKNTAAAAAAAAAEAAKELVVDAEPTKRNLPEEDAGMNSDASEGKRIKVKNYVEMFEKELENLNAELSGPLENTPSTDRISKAAIADTIEYI